MSTTFAGEILSGFNVAGGVENTKKRLRSEFTQAHPRITMSAALEDDFGNDPVVLRDSGREFDGAPDIPEIKQEPLDPGFAEAFGSLPEAEVALPPKKRRRSSRSAKYDAELKDQERAVVAERARIEAADKKKKKKTEKLAEKLATKYSRRLAAKLGAGEVGEDEGAPVVPEGMKLDSARATNILREKYDAELKDQERSIDAELAAMQGVPGGEKVAEVSEVPEVPEWGVPYAPSLLAEDRRGDIERKRAAVEKEKTGATYKTPVRGGMLRMGSLVAMGGFGMMVAAFFI